MSDYFLNKIYDSLLSNKPVPKKPIIIKESKKPSTLQQAYQLTLTRINEDTEIVMQDIKNDTPHGDVYSNIVSDDVANKIKREITKQEKFKTEEGEDVTVPQIIEQVVKIKNWYTQDVLLQIERAFDAEDINLEKFSGYAKKINEPNNPLRDKLFTKPQETKDYHDLIPLWFQELFFNKAASFKPGSKVADMLWNVKTKGVGRGEIALCLLSDAVKGKTGDLYFANGNFNIEMKGLGGYVEDDGHYANKTPIELNNILQKYNLTIQVTPKVYRDAVVPFFGYTEQLSDDDFINGIYAIRNYENLNNPEGIKATLKQIVSKNDMVKSRGLIPKNLTAALGALHLCAYQEKKQFKGIIFANDNTQKLVYLQFKGNTVYDNLKDTYNFLIKFNPSIKLTISAQQKAAGFLFNLK